MRVTFPARRGARVLPLALAALALGAAACSSSPSTSGAGTTTTAGGTSSTTTTSSSSATSTTAAGGSTTTTGAPTTCLASQLKFTVGQGNGAAGQIEETVTMTNTSSITCTLAGYPGMQLYDSAGNTIPTTVVRGQQQFGPAAANQAPTLVSLPKGSSAAFTLHYEDVPVGNETSCPQSASAHITPPDDFVSATVPLMIAPCNNGTVHVSPVYPAS